MWSRKSSQSGSPFCLNGNGRAEGRSLVTATVVGKSEARLLMENMACASDPFLFTGPKGEQVITNTAVNYIQGTFDDD